jgi:hypothetical protein
MQSRQCKTRSRKQRRNRSGLAMPEFDHEMAIRRDQPLRFARDRAIGVEPVNAAVEGAARVAADLRRECRDIVARDIRRIGHHQIEAAGERRAKIADDNVRAREQAEFVRVAACGRQRTDADNVGSFPFASTLWGGRNPVSYSSTACILGNPPMA